MAVTSGYLGSEKAHAEHHEEEHDPRESPDARSAAARRNERHGDGIHAHHLLEILGGARHSGVPGGDLLLLCLGIHDRRRPGCGRRDAPVVLGRLPGQYRVLDRHQPCRDVHLGDPARVEGGIPPPVHARRRVDDHLWPGPGWCQHLHAPGPCLAGLLDVPDPE